MNFNIPTELLPPYEMEWIRIRISHFRANLNIMHLAHFGGLDCAGDFGRLRIIQKMLFPLFASFQPMALNPSFDITQRWANSSVFEYIRIIWTEYIRIPNYSVLFKNRIIFVFVFGWNFQTEYIRIRIRLKISNRIYSYSYSVGRKFEYYSNSWIVEKITFERPQNNSRLTRPIGVGGSD